LNAIQKIVRYWTHPDVKSKLQEDCIVGFECNTKGLKEAAYMLKSVVENTMTAKTMYSKRLSPDFSGVFLDAGSDRIRLDSESPYVNTPFEADSQLTLYVIEAP